MNDSSLCPRLLPGDDRGHGAAISSVEPNTAMTLKGKMFPCDQQLTVQGGNISLGQEQPGLLQIKEEQEEMCISPEGEHVALKQEHDAFPLILTSGGKLVSPNSDEDEKKDWKETSVDTEAQSKETLHKNASHSCNIAHSSNFLVFHTYSLPLSESFECPLCGKDFRSECKLNEHMMFHTDVKPFCCDTCGKRFRHSSTLSLHERLHTGERPYPCKTCGKRLLRSHSLLVHTRQHTGEKPNLCQVCGKDFPSACILKVHLRKHTGERPFLCHICGKRFCQSTDLMQHTRVHTDERPYPCKTCGLNFKRSHALKVHTRRHTGEKPYSCQRCGKKFRVRGTLTIHTRKIHTGEKPYRCKLCGEKFTDYYSSSKHIRTHTDN